MLLTKKSLEGIRPGNTIATTDKKFFDLPEKILQFGTGVLLRGLPDYFVEKSNRRGVFNGRIVVVKSTSAGNVDIFKKQDGLYSIYTRGIQNGEIIEEVDINASISRVFKADESWDEILKVARQPELRIVISNTTEIGIVYSDDNIHFSPPVTYPGKLLSVLYERFRGFEGDPSKGMIIIPTEMIINNGKILRDILIRLSEFNGLEQPFIQWLKVSNHFCNSLVDRIVPGRLSAKDQAKVQGVFGYKDELMIMAEPFRLWAIEARSEKIRRELSFVNQEDGMIVTDNIGKYVELKLRVLNGTHTFLCGLAIRCGFATVHEAMSDNDFLLFAQKLMYDEICVSLQSELISYEEARKYATTIVSRFQNPFIEHRWSGIAVQYASKMRMRNVPLLTAHYRKFKTPPLCMAMAFAAFLIYMRDAVAPEDEYLHRFKAKWNNANIVFSVKSILADHEFWGIDLTEFTGFSSAVLNNFYLLSSASPLTAVKNIVVNNFR